MGPKRKPSGSARDVPVKRSKKVMTLSEKVKLLDKIKDGLSCSSVGRMFGVNESTLRYIKKNEKAIRDSLFIFV